jgi:hypothetical protein
VGDGPAIGGLTLVLRERFAATSSGKLHTQQLDRDDLGYGRDDRFYRDAQLVFSNRSGFARAFERAGIRRWHEFVIHIWRLQLGSDGIGPARLQFAERVRRTRVHGVVHDSAAWITAFEYFYKLSREPKIAGGD